MYESRDDSSSSEDDDSDSNSVDDFIRDSNPSEMS